ncbi:hypothetical protein JADG_005777 [Aureobasidium aubasidani]|nr:hypothetical protein JADG_005777 [Aureobasidium pullulans]
MSNPFTISQTDIDTMCSQLEPDPDPYTIPQIDEQDDENADTVQKTRQTTLSFVPSAMASSRQTILRHSLGRGHFRQRSDGNNVFIDKIMQGYTPFLLKLVRQQRLIRKLEEVDEDIFGIIMGVSSNLAVATGESQHPGIYQNMYWGWGLAVMLGIYISGGSSGAHLNPAISIALWIYRGFPARKLPTFIIFQALGAFTGGLIAIAIYRDAILYNDGGLIGSSSGIQIYTQPKEYVAPATAFFTEFAGTAILTCSILALGDDSNSPPGAGMHAFIIGLLTIVLVMSLGSNTGGCFNPVRDFGPRLAAMAMGYGTEIFTAYHNWWIWGAWGATISGGLTGGVLYDVCVFKGGESPVNYTPKKWQGKTNEGRLNVLQMFRQHTQARNLETAMEKGEVENGGS